MTLPRPGRWRAYIGRDWATIVAEGLKEAKRRGVVSLQLGLNTACPAIGAATAVLSKPGFFLGGLAPRRVDADGVVLQQLFDSEPDYEDTKLYSQEAKDLMAFIRADKEKIEGSNQPGAGIRQGR